MLSQEEGSAPYIPGADAPPLWFVLNVLRCYGVRRFLEDIDTRRAYWREGESILHSCLDWLATEGFEHLFARHDGIFADAQEYRDRYVIRALMAKRRTG